MLLRVLLILSITLSLSWAEGNVSSSVHPSYALDHNQSGSTLGVVPKDDISADTEHNTTISKNIGPLNDHDDNRTGLRLQSEPESGIKVKILDHNSSNIIGPTTKLDDISSLDIVKEQRKQRQKEREKEKSEDPTENQKRKLVDTIVVKGSVLQGQIDQLTSEYIRFKLIYGEGSIRIDYGDVESLITEHEYHIYFDGKETEGYITGIEDHVFLRIKHGKIEELIRISKIDRFIISENEDDSFENKMRNTFPYWSGNMDVGIEYESGTNTKKKLKTSGHIERKRTIYKTVLDITYSYETTETVDTPEVLNKHELYSFLEQDYSLLANDLFFIEIGYDFDVPRYVDNRLYPGIGYGYRIQSTKKRWVQFKVGGGYVYEDFIGSTDTDTNITRPNSTNKYVAGLLGIDGEYEIEDIALINRILLGAHLFYMPGARTYDKNWLLRYSITATLPLSKSLALKMVARDVSDSNPAPEVGNNKFTFDLYLSLRF